MELFSLSQALQNLTLLAIPAAIYAVFLRWRRAIPVREILNRLGLRRGPARGYVIALAFALPGVAIGIAVSSMTSTFENSSIAPFVGVPISAAAIGGALGYGVVATGFPEELLFRGLIAGALFRRLSFWTANIIQAAIFLFPHLLILLVAPQLWVLALVLPSVMGLALGWLRHSSGSIWPCVIVHSAGNVAGALAVLNWTAR